MHLEKIIATLLLIITHMRACVIINNNVELNKNICNKMHVQYKYMARTNMHFYFFFRFYYFAIIFSKIKY